MNFLGSSSGFIPEHQPRLCIGFVHIGLKEAFLALVWSLPSSGFPVVGYARISNSEVGIRRSSPEPIVIG